MRFKAIENLKPNLGTQNNLIPLPGPNLKRGGVFMGCYRPETGDSMTKSEKNNVLVFLPPPEITRQHVDMMIYECLDNDDMARAMVEGGRNEWIMGIRRKGTVVDGKLVMLDRPARRHETDKSEPSKPVKERPAPPPGQNGGKDDRPTRFSSPGPCDRTKPRGKKLLRQAVGEGSKLPRKEKEVRPLKKGKGTKKGTKKGC